MSAPRVEAAFAILRSTRARSLRTCPRNAARCGKPARPRGRIGPQGCRIGAGLGCLLFRLFRVGYGFWRERVGIEPTSRLATTSAILKTVRATRPVRSHSLEMRYFAAVSGHLATLARLYPRSKRILSVTPGTWRRRASSSSLLSSGEAWHFRWRYCRTH